MKKIFIMVFLLFCTLTFLLFGCAPQPSSTPDSQEPTIEDIISDSPDAEDVSYGMGIGVSNMYVYDDYVKLDYSFEPFPKGKEWAILAFQNGTPVPFSFEENGDYSTSHRKIFDNDVESSIYIQAQSFQKGESLNFAMGFIAEPDYIPPIQEYTRYNLHQFTGSYAKNFVAEQDFNGTITRNILTDIEWELYPDLPPSKPAGLINESDDISVLENLMHGEPANDTLQINAKGKDSFLTYYLMEADPENAFPGTITFYLDHIPLKINKIYDSAYVTPPETGFQMTSFEVMLPDNLEKGQHTFYTWLLGNEETGSQRTEKRILIY